MSGELTAGPRFSGVVQAIARQKDGTYALSFAGARTPVVADQVVLALPFAVLRTLNYAKAGFDSLKNTAIQDLGRGRNDKLQLQFRSRLWDGTGAWPGIGNGNSYADTGYQNTWEVTRAQPGAAGILVDYTGGAIGETFGTGDPTSHAQLFTSQIDPLIPGLSSRFNGRATIDFWKANPYTNGSYSYWKVGQYTAFAGAEREQSGNCHFAGEHTSVDFQGFLNGAVESGYRAAGEILAGFK
jgi:monoamine oxidase